jgi:ABC-type transporter Mla MlaB component
MDLDARRERPRLTLPAPVRRADLPALCDRARDLMQGRLDEALECDVAGVSRPDLWTIEALARLELIAMRQGTSLRLSGASVELLDLLAFCGLPVALVREREGETEEPEEARRVEEERDPGDPIA